MRLVSIVMIAVCASAADGGLWVSWDTFEPDSCAAAWMIKRHVDPKAQFKFLPKGTAIKEGTAFDVPESKLRRYATISATESIVREYRISDAAALEIGRIVHDIEINRWDRKSTALSREVEQHVRDIVAQSKSHADLLERTMAFFDELSKRIGSSGTNLK